MSDMKKLSELLKNAPLMDPPSDLTIVVTDALGQLMKHVSKFRYLPGFLADADTVANSFFQKTNVDTKNLPLGGNGGFLLNLAWDSDARIQIFLSFMNPLRILSRVRMAATWRDWKEFAMLN